MDKLALTVAKAAVVYPPLRLPAFAATAAGDCLLTSPWSMKVRTARSEYKMT